MNMNREAVDTALGLAGNMPLTDDDRKYRNLVYVTCLNLYLPTLFNALSEIDWRCARKYAKLHETLRRTVQEPGKYYYEIPADCIRPLQVDDNGDDFRNDTDFIITEYPAETLYYVFHRRRLRQYEDVEVSLEEGEFARLPYLAASPDAEDGYDPAYPLMVSPDEYTPPPAGEEEEFPDWEYTPYDADFWQYFSYKLAARLVPRLRMDDGAAGRVQALEALAKEKGEEAVERSRAASSNPSQPVKLWAERAGIGRYERGGEYAAPYKGAGGVLRFFQR
jgi:hypothetical protein